MATTTSYEIHPAIGIARLGPSHECFLGPGPLNQKDEDQQKNNQSGKLKRWRAREIDGIKPLLSYRDKTGKLKRQAVRFRVFKVGARQTNKEITSCKEMHGAGVTIAGSCTLSTARQRRRGLLMTAVRGSGGQYQHKLLRNPDVRGKTRTTGHQCRQTVAKGQSAATAQLLQGKFMGRTAVTLGHARTDNEGRLLVAGGYGISRVGKR